jgi:ABC-type sugar transport system ATPase subunit
VPLLELTGVSKAFGGVQALADVDLAVEGGEVRGLVGENGSGKTTLLRILAGELPADAGTVRVDGLELADADPTARLGSGVGVVFQEARVAPELTVAENMFLGRLPTRRGAIDWSDVNRRAQAVLDRAAFPLRASTRVRSISQDARHLTEVARVDARDCRVLAFDETTASLTADHVARIFDLIRRRREDGAAIVFISHRLNEVFAICDSITVLRDGRVTGTLAVADADEDRVIRMMVGRDLESQFFREGAQRGEPRLRVRGLTAGSIRSPVDVEVRAGEVLGIGGLVGSGRTTLLEAIYGLIPRSGDVLVDDAIVSAGNPRAAMRAGIGFVPEDRRASGLAMEQSVRANATLVLTGSRSLLRPVSPEREQQVIQPLFDRLALKARNLRAPVRTLSGGNQQKIVLGRWLAQRPKVLLLDEPTRGIDVGTKRQIYDLIHAFAEEGMSVVLVSSELPELLGLCDRIVVFREGEVVAGFDRGVSEEALAAAMAATRTA